MASQLTNGSRYAFDEPAAWKVPTVGAVCMNVAVIGGPGTIGSWTWTMSTSSSHSPRMVRRAQAGSGAMGATDPFDAVGTELPSGRMPGSGGGTVAGAEHDGGVAERPQRAGQTQDLTLYAAREGQAVRRHQSDPHGARLGRALPSLV